MLVKAVCILSSVIPAKAYRRQLKDLIPSFWSWIGRNPVTRTFITLRYAGMDPAVKPRDDELELRDDEEVYEISVKMKIAVIDTGVTRYNR